MHFPAKLCPNSDQLPRTGFDSWQRIGISRHLWQPNVSLQGAGGGVSTHCSALLSRAAASTLLSTKKGSMSTPKVVFFMRLQYRATVQSCFAMFLLCIFALNLYSKRAQWGKASLRDIYTTLCLRQCTLKSWLNCFYIITFIRHMHPYFPGMSPAMGARNQ